MTSDERNFRSAYYEKVGCRSVEEKKSLEILLKDKPLDKGKLKQFCLRFCVPAAYRNLLWKLLLGVVPVHTDCHNFIMSQRKQEYNDLLRALTVMRIIDQNVPKPQIFLAMWLLQTGDFTLHTVNLNATVGYTQIVQSLNQYFDDDVDVYWLGRNFYGMVRKYSNDIPRLVECSYSLLEKEDAVLHNHLQKYSLLTNLPLTKWFDCCFAGVLKESALGKIWDKICGGSYKILAYVAVVLLTNLKHRLMKCNVIFSALECVKNISEDAADVIATKAVDLWQQNGSPLTVDDKQKI